VSFAAVRVRACAGEKLRLVKRATARTVIKCLMGSILLRKRKHIDQKD